MDKIDRSKLNMYMMGDSVVVDLLDKVDELVEFVDGLQKLAEKQETVK